MVKEGEVEEDEQEQEGQLKRKVVVSGVRDETS